MNEAHGQQAMAGIALTGLYRRQQRTEDCLREAEKAMAAAERAADAKVGPFQTQFVRAKLALADAHFAVGQLGACEDELFNAIRTIPELLDSVVFALDLYARMWGLNDEQLEAGQLPRDEVEEGWAELLAILDAKFQEPRLGELARARFQLLVQGQSALAEKLVAELPARGQESGKEKIDGPANKTTAGRPTTVARLSPLERAMRGQLLDALKRSAASSQ
jgi:hypothetical protein